MQVYHNIVKSKPPIVSTVLARGSYAYVGILHDNPSTVLKWPAIRDPHTLECFETEKRAFELLGQHQHIVNYLWANETGICLEYCAWGPIRYHYGHHGLPDINRRLLWCHQAISAVAHLHSKGLVHCDISTRNCLLAENLDVKLCDFGATVRAGEFMHGVAELHYGGARRPQDSLACISYDLFCMGGLLYEIIGGKQPFCDLDRFGAMQKYSQEVYPSLDGIDLQYARVIQNCWSGK
jgi:serine/threonine protein kinase